jgi:4-amino-4-deoxy-L-arabinose transferase-like glycosyltransferase
MNRRAQSWLRELGAARVSALVLLCVGLRLSLFVAFAPWNPTVEHRQVLNNDAEGYHRLATTLIASRTLAYGPREAPNAFRTPLYPGLIAGVYSVFGYRPWVVILIQIGLDVASCVLLLAALFAPFGSRPAFAAALLYALDPFLILSASASLLSDTLFVFLLVVALWFASRGRHDEPNGTFNYGMCGFFLGLATLTRPVSLYALAGPLLFVLVAYRRRPRTALTFAFVIALAFVLAVAPWLLRNHRTFGRYALSNADAYALLTLNVMAMEVGSRHTSVTAVRDQLLAEADDLIIADGLRPQDLNGFQKADYWQRLALRYIRRNPVGFSESYAIGVFHTLFSVGVGGYADTLRLPVGYMDMTLYPSAFALLKEFIATKGVLGLVMGAVVGVYLLVTYVATVVGVVVSSRRYHDRAFLMMLLMLAAYFVLVTGGVGVARYKLPAEPFYLAFAGIGCAHLSERLRARRRGRLERLASSS